MSFVQGLIRAGVIFSRRLSGGLMPEKAGLGHSKVNLCSGGRHMA